MVVYNTICVCFTIWPVIGIVHILYLVSVGLGDVSGRVCFACDKFIGVCVSLSINLRLKRFCYTWDSFATRVWVYMIWFRLWLLGGKVSPHVTRWICMFVFKRGMYIMVWIKICAAHNRRGLLRDRFAKNNLRKFRVWALRAVCVCLCVDHMRFGAVGCMKQAYIMLRDWLSILRVSHIWIDEEAWGANDINGIEPRCLAFEKAI